MNSHCTDDFWKLYNALPKSVRDLADETYRKWKADTSHPSLHFKKLRKQQCTWGVRIGIHYRAVCDYDKTDSTYTWWWVGTKEEFKALFGGT